MSIVKKIVGGVALYHVEILLNLVMIHYIGKLKGAAECDQTDKMQAQTEHIGFLMMGLAAVNFCLCMYQHYQETQYGFSTKTQSYVKYTMTTLISLFFFNIGYKLAYKYEELYSNNKEELMKTINILYIFMYVCVIFGLIGLEVISFASGNLTGLIIGEQPGSAMAMKLQQIRSRLTPSRVTPPARY